MEFDLHFLPFCIVLFSDTVIFMLLCQHTLILSAISPSFQSGQCLELGSGLTTSSVPGFLKTTSNRQSPFFTKKQLVKVISWLFQYFKITYIVGFLFQFYFVLLNF